MIDSSVLTVDARFGFTKRFPTASSTVGIAVKGDFIGSNHLVVVYTGPEGWQNGFKVWWSGKQILAGYPSEFSDDVLVASFAEMNPDDYHTNARHTIGGTSGGGTLPSYSFTFKKANIMIYCLLGPDNMNAVIEMSRLPGKQDGLCGNFNCNGDDDHVEQLRARGYMDALTQQESTFALQADVKPAVIQQGSVPEDLLERCDKALLDQGKVACGKKHLHDALVTACLIDVCMANSLSVAALDDALGNVEEQIVQDYEQKESAHHR
jgi:hypothetical protein